MMRANVYFVASGPSWSLIDTAYARSADTIRQEAERVFGAGARPTAILLTHAHPDHGGAALDLAERWDCPVYVSEAEYPLAVATDMATYARFASPLDHWLVLPILRLIPGRRGKPPVEAARLKRSIKAFDPAAGMPGLPEWRGIPTPGHTPGHVAFFRPGDRVVIAGDAVLTVEMNSVTSFTWWSLGWSRQRVSGPLWSSTWNRTAAERSIVNLADLAPAVLACGHGRPMTGSETAPALCDFAARLRRTPNSGSRRSIGNRMTTMVHIDGEVTINRPVETVFDCVADERNEPQYNPRLQRVEQVTDGPIGVGTQFRAMTTTMGRPAELTIEFKEFERPRRLTSVTMMAAMDIAGTLTFDPVPTGTRMRWSWDVQPRGANRLLTPLIARIGKRQELEIWTGLKRYLEGARVSSPPQRVWTPGDVDEG